MKTYKNTKIKGIRVKIKVYEDSEESFIIGITVLLILQKLKSVYFIHFHYMCTINTAGRRLPVPRLQ